MAVELHELVVGDEPGAWHAAGFAVDGDGVVRIGQVQVRLAGREGGKRIRSWSLRGLPPGTRSIDGIATAIAPGAPDAPEPAPPGPGGHPNGVVAVDHVVLLSPDVDRTTTALRSLGVELRRTREIDEAQYGFPAVQRFFRLGEPILELVGAAEPTGDGPAGFFGLAFTVTDIDALPARFGGALGRVKDAVQPGRRIATLRHKQLDISVATAFMSP